MCHSDGWKKKSQLFRFPFPLLFACSIYLFISPHQFVRWWSGLNIAIFSHFLALRLQLHRIVAPVVPICWNLSWLFSKGHFTDVILTAIRADTEPPRDFYSRYTIKATASLCNSRMPSFQPKKWKRST